MYQEAGGRYRTSIRVHSYKDISLGMYFCNIYLQLYLSIDRDT